MALGTPTLLDGAGATNPSATITSASISPSANAVLIIAVGSKSLNGSHIWTISGDTFSDTLTFTKVAEIQTTDGGNDNTLTVFRCQMDGTPGSGTITATSRNDADTSDVNTNRRVLTIVEYTGHDEASPVAQFKTGSAATGTTGSVTLDSSLGSGAGVFGVICAVDEAGFITPGTDFTELDDTRVGAETNNVTVQAQYDNGPADGVIDWSDLDDIKLMIGLEISEEASGDISGTSDGVATTTAALDGDGDLAGSISGSASQTSALTGDGELTGVIAGGSTAQGDLQNLSGDMDGASNSSATTQGVLEGAGELSSVSPGISTATANLSANAFLSGLSVGASSSQGELVQEGVVSGLSDGGSSASATISSEFIAPPEYAGRYSVVSNDNKIYSTN
jgi:hypothetical protein